MGHVGIILHFGILGPFLKTSHFRLFEYNVMCIVLIVFNTTEV